MKDKEYYEPKELNTFDEFKKFEAVEYYKVAEAKIINENPVIKEVSSIENNDGSSQQNIIENKKSSQSNESDSFGLANKINDTIANSVSTATTVGATSAAGATAASTIAGTVATVTAAVVACTTFIAKMPTATITIEDRGMDYVSYTLDVSDIEDDRSYYLKITNSSFNYVVPITTDGTYKDIVSGLSPYLKYDIEFVGDNGEVGGTTTYLSESFYTLRDTLPSATLMYDYYNLNTVAYTAYVSDYKKIGRDYYLDISFNDESIYQSYDYSDGYISGYLYELKDGEYTFNVYGTFYDDEEPTLLQSDVITVPFDNKNVAISDVKHSVSNDYLDIKGNLNKIKSTGRLECVISYTLNDSIKSEKVKLDTAKDTFDIHNKIPEDCLFYEAKIYLNDKVVYAIEKSSIAPKLILESQNVIQAKNKLAVYGTINLFDELDGYVELNYVDGNNQAHKEAKEFTVNNQSFDVVFDNNGIDSYSYKIFVNEKELYLSDNLKYNIEYPISFNKASITSASKSINSLGKLDIDVNVDFNNNNNEYSLKVILLDLDNNEVASKTISDGTNVLFENIEAGSYKLEYVSMRTIGEEEFIFDDVILDQSFSFEAPSFEVTDLEFTANSVIISFNQTHGANIKSLKYIIDNFYSGNSLTIDLLENNEKIEIELPNGIEAINLSGKLEATHEDISGSFILEKSYQAQNVNLLPSINSIDEFISPDYFVINGSLINNDNETGIMELDIDGSSKVITFDIINGSFNLEIEAKNINNYSYSIIVDDVKIYESINNKADISFNGLYEIDDLNNGVLSINTDLTYEVSLNSVFNSSDENEYIRYELYDDDKLVDEIECNENKTITFNNLSLDKSYTLIAVEAKKYNGKEYVFNEELITDSLILNAPHLEIDNVLFDTTNVIIDYKITNNVDLSSFTIKVTDLYDGFEAQSFNLTEANGVIKIEIPSDLESVNLNLSLEAVLSNALGKYVEALDTKTVPVDLEMAIYDIETLLTPNMFIYKSSIINSKVTTGTLQLSYETSEHTLSTASQEFTIDSGKIETVVELSNVVSYSYKVIVDEITVYESETLDYTVENIDEPTVEAIDSSAISFSEANELKITSTITDYKELDDVIYYLTLVNDGATVETKTLDNTGLVEFSGLDYKGSYSYKLSIYKVFSGFEYLMKEHEYTEVLEVAFGSFEIGDTEFTTTGLSVDYELTDTSTSATYKLILKNQLDTTKADLEYVVDLLNPTIEIALTIDVESIDYKVFLEADYGLSGKITEEVGIIKETVNLKMELDNIELLLTPEKLVFTSDIINSKVTTGTLQLSYETSEHTLSTASQEFTIESGKIETVVELSNVVTYSYKVIVDDVTVYESETLAYTVENIDEPTVEAIDSSAISFSEANELKITSTITDYKELDDVIYYLTLVNDGATIETKTLDNTGLVEFSGLDYKGSYSYKLSIYKVFSGFEYLMKEHEYTEVLEVAFGSFEIGNTEFTTTGLSVGYELTDTSTSATYKLILKNQLDPTKADLEYVVDLLNPTIEIALTIDVESIEYKVFIEADYGLAGKITEEVGIIKETVNLKMELDNIELLLTPEKLVFTSDIINSKVTTGTLEISYETSEHTLSTASQEFTIESGKIETVVELSNVVTYSYKVIVDDVTVYESETLAYTVENIDEPTVEAIDSSAISFSEANELKITSTITDYKELDDVIYYLTLVNDGATIETKTLDNTGLVEFSGLDYKGSYSYKLSIYKVFSGFEYLMKENEYTEVLEVAFGSFEIGNTEFTTTGLSVGYELTDTSTSATYKLILKNQLDPTKADLEYVVDLLNPTIEIALTIDVESIEYKVFLEADYGLSGKITEEVGRIKETVNLKMELDNIELLLTPEKLVFTSSIINSKVTTGTLEISYETSEHTLSTASQEFTIESGKIETVVELSNVVTYSYKVIVDEVTVYESETLAYTVENIDEPTVEAIDSSAISFSENNELKITSTITDYKELDDVIYYLTLVNDGATIETKTLDNTGLVEFSGLDYKGSYSYKLSIYKVFSGFEYLMKENEYTEVLEVAFGSFEIGNTEFTTTGLSVGYELTDTSTSATYKLILKNQLDTTKADLEYVVDLTNPTIEIDLTIDVESIEYKVFIEADYGLAGKITEEVGIIKETVNLKMELDNIELLLTPEKLVFTSDIINSKVTTGTLEISYETSEHTLSTASQEFTIESGKIETVVELSNVVSYSYKVIVDEVTVYESETLAYTVEEISVPTIDPIDTRSNITVGENNLFSINSTYTGSIGSSDVIKVKLMNDGELVDTKTLDGTGSFTFSDLEVTGYYSYSVEAYKKFHGNDYLISTSDSGETLSFTLGDMTIDEYEFTTNSLMFDVSLTNVIEGASYKVLVIDNAEIPREPLEIVLDNMTFEIPVSGSAKKINYSIYLETIYPDVSGIFKTLIDTLELDVRLLPELINVDYIALDNDIYISGTIKNANGKTGVIITKYYDDGELVKNISNFVVEDGKFSHNLNIFTNDSVTFTILLDGEELYSSPNIDLGITCDATFEAGVATFSVVDSKVSIKLPITYDNSINPSELVRVDLYCDSGDTFLASEIPSGGYVEFNDLSPDENYSLVVAIYKMLGDKQVDLELTYLPDTIVIEKTKVNLMYMTNDYNIRYVIDEASGTTINSYNLTIDKGDGTSETVPVDTSVLDGYIDINSYVSGNTSVNIKAILDVSTSYGDIVTIEEKVFKTYSPYIDTDNILYDRVSNSLNIPVIGANPDAVISYNFDGRDEECYCYDGKFVITLYLYSNEEINFKASQVDENGKLLSEEFDVIYSFVIDSYPRYSFNAVNPGSIPIYYNDDGTFNFEIDVNFDPQGSDLKYTVVLYNDDRRLVYESTDNVFKLNNFDPQGSSYYSIEYHMYYTSSNGMRCDLVNTVPSGSLSFKRCGLKAKPIVSNNNDVINVSFEMYDPYGYYNGYNVTLTVETEEGIQWDSSTTQFVSADNNQVSLSFDMTAYPGVIRYNISINGPGEYGEIIYFTENYVEFE